MRVTISGFLEKSLCVSSISYCKILAFRGMHSNYKKDTILYFELQKKRGWIMQDRINAAELKQQLPSEVKDEKLVDALSYLYQYQLIFYEGKSGMYIKPPKSVRSKANQMLMKNAALAQYIRMAGDGESIEVKGELLNILAEAVRNTKPRSSDLENDALDNNCQTLNDMLSHQRTIENINYRNIWLGNTILLSAIANGSCDFAWCLLDYPDTTHVNLTSLGYSHCTPLTLCFSKGYNHHDNNGKAQKYVGEIAQKLIEKGANIHGVDKHQRAALHYACLHRDLEAIQFLISKGANLNSPDSNGQTPLDYLFYDYTTAVDILSNATGGNVGYTFTLDQSQFAATLPHSFLSTFIPNHLVEHCIKTANENIKIRETLAPLYQHAVILANEVNENIYTDYLDDDPTPKNISRAREFYKIYMELLSAISSINVENSERLAKITEIMTNVQNDFYGIENEDKKLILNWYHNNQVILQRPVVSAEPLVVGSGINATVPGLKQGTEEQEGDQQEEQNHPSLLDQFIRKHADKRGKFSSTHLGLYQNVNSEMIIAHAAKKSTRTFQVLKEMGIINEKGELTETQKNNFLAATSNNALVNEFIQKHVASRGLFSKSKLGLYEHVTADAIIKHAQKSKASFFKNRSFTILREMKVIDEKGEVTEKGDEFLGSRPKQQ